MNFVLQLPENMHEFTASLPTDDANVNLVIPLGMYIFTIFYKALLQVYLSKSSMLSFEYVAGLT